MVNSEWSLFLYSYSMRLKSVSTSFWVQ